MIHVSAPDIGELEADLVSGAVLAGELASGRAVPRFERMLADFSGHTHAVSCCNGSIALHLALEALDVRGCEVIVPTLTYVATAAAVVQAGATPVFVDSLPDGTMDPDCVRRALTSTTRAVLPVYLYGKRAHLEDIEEVAPGCAILIDAAEAHGVELGGRTATYSFYGNKVLTTGEGGAVVTNSGELARRMRWLRGQCCGEVPSNRYAANGCGYNYRMSNLTASVGVAQLLRAREMIRHRWSVFGWYRELCPLPVDRCDVPWLVNVYVLDRERVAAGLAARGVETRPFFPPIHNMLPYVGYPYVGGETAQQLSATGLSLPCSSTMSRADVEHVCSALKEVL